MTKDGGQKISQGRYNPICLEIDRMVQGIAAFQRQLSPANFIELRHDLLPLKASFDQAVSNIREESMRDDLGETAEVLEDSIRLVIDALEMILTASRTDFREAFVQIMRARRKICQAQEKLYPLRLSLPPLNRIFLEPEMYGRLETLEPRPPEAVLTGLNHFGDGDDRYARGAVSLYVPEYYDDSVKWPVVVALHGGSGHGRDFVWTWLREARSRGFVLLSPSSKDTTWSIYNPEIDGHDLNAMIEYLGNQYNFDMGQVLLTGMSDGATFALEWCLENDSPFTALAPVSGVLPPMDLNSARGKRIYLVHGALDWMFPVERTMSGYEMLLEAGADISLNIINDLSHTYPHEENKNILEWFDPKLALD